MSRNVRFARQASSVPASSLRIVGSFARGVPLTQSRVELRHQRIIPLAAVAQQPFRAASLVLQRRGALEKSEPAANRLDVAGVELLLLHEDLLAHAHLSEIVQQAGV